MRDNKAFTVWFTGLTGAGKNTLALLLKRELASRGLHAEVISGAEIRKTIISDELGFNHEDRARNVLRMGEVCRLLNRNGIISIAAAVSPDRASREKNRRRIVRYIEVWCRCPLEVLKSRDTGEFYKRAEAGEITSVAGIDYPYEDPEKPEVIVNTDESTPMECMQHILSTLEILKYIESRKGATYTPEEEELIKDHLRRMGYL